tara:strand:- start:10620 stop:12386 length:1767 start_codon:yes stop_codon:yes gene_type:complete
MPLPYKIYTGQSGTGPFSFAGIDFITGISLASQINVYLNGTKLTQGTDGAGADYHVGETSQSITLKNAITGTDELEIRRETEDLTRLSLFQDGAKLSAETLNKSFNQLFFLIQEKSFYSTSLEQFPQSLININGVSNRDTITWEAAQGKFVPGQLNIGIDELNDVVVSSTPPTNDVLTWTGTSWTPSTNVSFDVGGNHTFSGSCSFTSPLTVAVGTADGHAVNRGQLDSIMNSHANTYTQGLVQRIEQLEKTKSIVLGRGRYYNTQGDYHCKLEPGITGTTYPVFDTSAAQADWENIYNLNCRAAYYLYSNCDNHVQGGSFISTAWLDHTAWDIFSWDFSFEDTLVVDDKSRANVNSHQYQVIVNIDGESDDFETSTRNFSGNYSRYVKTFADDNLQDHGEYGFGTQSSGFNPTASFKKGNWPFYRDLHIYAGGSDNQPPMRTWNADSNNEGNVSVGGSATRWGEQHYGLNKDYYTNRATNLGYIESQLFGMSMMTEPMTMFGVFNKDDTGFTIMYAIKRPLVWYAAPEIGSSLGNQTPNSAFGWEPRAYMYRHTSAQSWNDGTYDNNVQYGGHPLLEDFNFNVTVLQ